MKKPDRKPEQKNPKKSIIKNANVKKRSPRDIAIEVLAKVLGEKHSLDQVMATLKDPQIHWVQDVCSGVLRYHGRLQGYLALLSLKSKPTGRIGRALEIALYQMLYHDEISPEQVADETVEWIKKKDGLPPSRFANAVLRKAVKHLEEFRNPVLTDAATDAEWAAWCSLPIEWISILKKERGSEWLKAFAVKSLERPQFWMRVRGQSEPKPIVQARAIAQDTQIISGDAFVQDISSQKVVGWVGEHLKQQGVKKILDYCASPGGKSVGLSWDGFEVSSFEISPKRKIVLADNLKRLAPDVRLLNADEIKAQKWDAIWVDAPCSGTGTLNKNPEIRWVRSTKDIENLVSEQAKIVDSVLPLLKPKGILIYSVCSVLQSELPEQMLQARGLKLFESLSLDPQQPQVGDGFQVQIYHA